MMFRVFMFLLLALLPGSGVLADGGFRGQHYEAHLVSRSQSLAPGEKALIALVINSDAGWHIYWRNPGESGYAPGLDWHLPNGFSVGSLRYPVPDQLVLGGFSSNVYERQTILLQDIAVPAPLAAGTVQSLGLDLDLLVCSESTCVPDPGKLSMTIPVGTGSNDPQQAKLFAMALAALPKAAPQGAEIVADPGGFRIWLPGIHISAGDKAHIFGVTPSILSDGKPQQFSDSANGTLAVVKAGSEKLAAALPIVLRVEHANGSTSGFSLTALPVRSLPEKDGQGGAGWSTFLLALGGAFLGGLILNLMPCVFPILSLKALALAKAGGDDHEARSEAIGYSIGAIGVIMALGAILLIVRSSGSALGWAFQLQDMRVVALLLLLVTAIALNMAGLFELPSLSVTGQAKPGLAGSIGTGALAAFIATPCTGPFMAGALGAALLLPAPAAMAIFFGLGLGLSLPFLVLGFWKRSRSWLPRPGAWMIKLRQMLSLPMFATALGLAWIIGRQGSTNSMAVAIGAALLLGLALWWHGLRQQAGKPFWPVAVPALAALLLAFSPAMQVEAGRASAAPETNATPFSPEKLAELRNRHQPVFLYMTADWCLSCKVNEATSLSSETVLAAFKRAGITVMRGDWTNGDPAITAYLQDHHRAGVPIYIWYPKTGPSREMPQVLTPALLLSLAGERGAG